MSIKNIAIMLLFVNTWVFAQQDLVNAAKTRLKQFVIYDGSYQQIAYPNGDVDDHKGVCTDVVIRSYRLIGKDLQKLVHEDMLAHFQLYPQTWGLKKTDSNIDHRRVPNLETFFSRHGKSLIITDDPQDYKPGDIISWRLDNNLPHIGIVSDVPSKYDSKRMQIIHNIGLGPQLQDMLFDYKIVGHFSY
jgi:uncharacterized protein YijF (DUF1287 family)